MFIFLRFGLTLLGLFTLLVAGSLPAGYLSQTTVMTVAKSIDGDTYFVEVWDIPRLLHLPLAGTRCFDVLPTATTRVHEPYMGWTMPSGHYFTRRSDEATDAIAMLQC